MCSSIMDVKHGTGAECEGRKCCQCSLGGDLQVLKDVGGQLSLTCQARTLIYQEQAVADDHYKVLSCANAVSGETKQLYRASVNKPFLSLCPQHVQQMSSHHQCPVCGYFCEYGALILCQGNRSTLTPHHLQHRPCLDVAVPSCPHCYYTISGIENTHRRMALVNATSVCSEYRSMLYPSDITSYKSVSIGTDGMLKISKSDQRAIKVVQCEQQLENEIECLETEICTSNPFHETYLFFKDWSIDLGLYLFNDTPSRHHLLSSYCKCLKIARTRKEEFGDLSQRFHTCVKNNNLESFLLLLISCSTCDQLNDLILNSGNMSDLLYSAISHNASTITVSILLQVPWVNINYQDSEGRSCLMLAAARARLDLVKQLLTAGVDVNRQDVDGRTALMLSLKLGVNKNIARMLLAAPHLDLTLLDTNGESVLHHAARNDNALAFHLISNQCSRLSKVRNSSQQTAADIAKKDKCPIISSLSFNSYGLLLSDLSGGCENRMILCYNEVDSNQKPPQFIYMKDSSISPTFDQDASASHLTLCCSCVGTCAAPECECIMNSSGHTYLPDGRLDLDSMGEDEDLAIFECNSRCSCHMSCTHRVIQKGIQCQLHVFKTLDRGWGTRAGGSIKRGQFVAEYVGEIIPDRVAETRIDGDTYLFDLKDLSLSHEQVACVDAKYKGNVARFVNHLCEPNLTVKYFFIDQSDIRIPRVAFFANRDVSYGEELGFDYGYQFWSVKYKEFLCECGSDVCKYNSASKVKKLIKELKNLED